MNLLKNVAIESLGAKIQRSSSFIDDLHQPSNILKPIENSLWSTTEGLPQSVIVSLENLNVNFKNINEVGFMLWHDYDSNPKAIQLWVAQSTSQQFIFWTQFFLDQKKGIQLFKIQPLPSRFIYLKIFITETYGAFQTYLNQIFLMAEQVTSKKIEVKKKKQLNFEDLQSNLKQLIETDKRITRSKSNKKAKQQKVLNKNIRQSDFSSKGLWKNQKNQQKTDKHLFRGSLSSNRGGSPIYYHESQHLANEQSHEYVSNDYQSNSSNGYDRELRARTLRENQQEQEFEQEHQQEGTSKEDQMADGQQSEDFQGEQFMINDANSNMPMQKQVQFENQDQLQSEEKSSEQELISSQQQKIYTAALLALSKNVIKLEDNMEALQRKVKVLDMKIIHSHEKIQKQIFEKIQNKVEQIVDGKLKKIYSVKNVLQGIQKSNKKKKDLQNRKTFENENEKFNYKKNLTKQFFKSDYQEQEENFPKQKDKTMTKKRMKGNIKMKHQKEYEHAKMEDENNFHNRLKTSKSFAHITTKAKHLKHEYEITRKQNHQTKRQGLNQQYIANLLEKLNAKLKERQVKLHKMQQREKDKKRNPKKELL